MTSHANAAHAVARQRLSSSTLVVVKVGTAVLTGGTGAIDRGYVTDLAAMMCTEMDRGRRFIVVSSGAVGAGVGALGLPGRPTDVPSLQAAAAVGQPLLMSIWREALSIRSAQAAQILLSRADFDSRERFLNIRNCVQYLLQGPRVIPVVNENDTVATEEISLGDNDVLAAKLAVSVGAGALIILTTGPGVLDASDRIVSHASDAASLAAHVRPIKTTQGRGGMATKVEAARIAGLAGVTTVIAPGRPAQGLARLLAGEDLGTICAASEDPAIGRRRWIGLSATPAGSVRVDDGAARAIRERGASLLPKGVVAVEGDFAVGDVIAIRDQHGAELARGLSNLSAQECRAAMGAASSQVQQVLGRQVHEEVVHRDNLVVSSRSSA